MGPRKDYTPEQMEKAIALARNGVKIATAAKQFGVPRITLHDKVTGKTPVSCTMGPSTILTKTEEEILVRWILALCERHFPIPRDSLLDTVQKIITEQNRPNPFTNNRPGKKWFQSFMKRSKLVEKMPENLTKARDDVTEEQIRKWFQEIEDYLEEKGLKEILKDPKRIYNSDESAFFLSPKPGRVLAKKGEKHLYSSCGDEKDNLTVLFTGNAAGELAPPMIVFNYERIPSNIVASVPDGWGIGKSDSGWMCSSTFFEYMTNIFNPWLEKMEIEKPVLFFLDGHRSHLTLHLSNFCSENGIELIALYPNTTHILQPLDLSVFRPLKVAWKKATHDWKLDNLGKTLRKENFAPVLQKAVSKITKECIKNGFRAGGLHPFGPDYIDLSKIQHRTQITADKSDPAQKEFLKYLESEIVKTFSMEKLNFFNKVYYEKRSSMEDCLPNEDMTLYIIWAKNKSKDGCMESVDDLPSTSFLRQQKNAPMEQSSDIVNNLCGEDEPSCLVPTTAKSLTEKDIDPAVVISTDPQINLDNQQGHTVSKSSSPSTIESFNALLVCEGNESTQPEPMITEHNYASNIVKDPRVSQIPTHTSKTQETVNNSNNSHSSIENTMVHENISAFESNRTDKTPVKKTVSDVLGCKVPTPFKKHLFWPENDDKKKRRIKREKIPAAVTSKAWQEYYEKKEKEKRKQEEEKDKRKKQRLEKKLLKEKIAEEKKSKSNLKLKRRKKVTKEESNSDETDMEIEYAESDDSIDTDTENLPLCKFRNKSGCDQTKRINKGNYVIVKYEGEYFPGRVENVHGNQFEVSTMVLSSGQSFKWPDKLDIIWYNNEQVIEKINEPVCLNNRGFYKIDEMRKYLPDIYL